MARHDVTPVGTVEVARVIGIPAGRDVTVTGISDDTRSVAPGDLFVCIRGSSFDPHLHVDRAVAAGAAALLVDSPVRVPPEVCVIRVPDVRTVIGPLAAALFGRPADSLVMVGVTGTNGKTSTASFVGSLLRSAGHRVMVLGTLSGARTTPEAIDLHAQLASAVQSGITHVVMEVSSHALVMGRVNGIRFDTAVFTNLSRDHIDFHGSMEEYKRAKFALFTEARARIAVINVDDPAGAELAATATLPVTASSSRDLGGLAVDPTSVSYVWHGHRVSVPVGGAFTVDNSRLALDACVALGMSPQEVAAASTGLEPVPGRMQPVPTGDLGFGVIVDYAHTPEALGALLATVRAMCDGRVICVFGCGGDRDKGKRPEMGRAAASASDVVWVTSDNPRNEDPMTIIEEIIAGTGTGSAHVNVEPDRSRAIESAIRGARRGDIVVVAGKGHETYQEVAGRFLEFSDMDAAAAAVTGRRGTK